MTKTSKKEVTKIDPMLEPLDRLVGTWDTEGTHPAFPGVLVRGTVTVEWLEGKSFLIHRGHVDHPDFPDSISIIGLTDQDRVHKASAAAHAVADGRQLSLHYYDSRGVFRLFDASADDQSWRFWRNAPGFSQRFTGTFADGGDVIVGVTQLCEDDVTWKDDLLITYRRRKYK